MAKKTIDLKSDQRATEVQIDELQPPATTSDVAERRALYNRLVRTAQLQDIALIGLNYALKPQYHMIPENEHKRSVDGQLVSVSDPSDDGSRVAQIRWTVGISHSRKSLAKFDATYVIFYSGMEKVPEEIVNIFMGSVALGATYSYFRSVCAQLDWAGGLRLPPLPLQQFTPNL